MLAAAGVVEVIAGEGGSPGLEDPDESSFRQRLLHAIFRDIGQTQPRFRGINSLRQAV